MKNGYITYIPYGIRSGAITSTGYINTHYRGVFLIARIVILASTNIVISMLATDHVSGTDITAHTLTTLAATGNYIIELYPGIDTTGGGPFNPHFSHTMPYFYKIQATPTGGGSNGFSVTGHLLV